jgi:hypothetical protein
MAAVRTGTGAGNYFAVAGRRGRLAAAFTCGTPSSAAGATLAARAGLATRTGLTAAAAHAAVTAVVTVTAAATGSASSSSPAYAAARGRVFGHAGRRCFPYRR